MAVVSPSNTFNSVAVDVTNVLPNIRPFIPSCEATTKLFVPSSTVTSPFTLKLPVAVIFLNPEISLLASTTTALLVETVPGVIFNLLKSSELIKPASSEVAALYVVSVHGTFTTN